MDAPWRMVLVAYNKRSSLPLHLLPSLYQEIFRQGEMISLSLIQIIHQ
jgi:hypothetical protein